MHNNKVRLKIDFRVVMKTKILIFHHRMGLLLVLSITYCVNLFRNLGYSRLYTALRTEAGAHPPGLTTEQYVILVVRLSLEALSLVRSPSTTVSHTKQTVKPTLKQPPWFSGASGCLVDCKIKVLDMDNYADCNYGVIHL